ncbi:hypothetical protein GGR53DRAFT_464536 [Hypoxylon sp. FL1150]|nr:hypothetical protein GGR53DRAFT_464536 [Hypoxylon sp. FL1150]
MDASGFLDRFAQYMQLYRAVRNITAEAWHLILESDMGSVLRKTSKVMNNKSVCQDALKKIHWVLSRVDGPEKQHPSDFAMFLSFMSWPVVIDVDFLRLVSDRTPEALLALSHYAILLHLCRDIRVIGASGQLPTQSVRLHLDDKLHGWLEWPERMMDTLSYLGTRQAIPDVLLPSRMCQSDQFKLASEDT